MPSLYLLLGTNLGERETNIRQALKMLDAAFGAHDKLSEVVETEAVGFDGEPFLNCVARFHTRKWPETVLRICKDIEYSMGRREQMEFAPDGSRIYHNRIIDIDILLYGKRRVSSPTLTIPHPQVEERPFVKPLLEQVI